MDYSHSYNRRCKTLICPTPILALRVSEKVKVSLRAKERISPSLERKAPRKATPRTMLAEKSLIDSSRNAKKEKAQDPNLIPRGAPPPISKITPKLIDPAPGIMTPGKMTPDGPPMQHHSDPRPINRKGGPPTKAKVRIATPWRRILRFFLAKSVWL